ncbi:zinc knuckle CX2CX4HX4C containing protein [Tanacetum coccineum]
MNYEEDHIETITVSVCLLQSRMSNTSDKGTMFGDGAARSSLKLLVGDLQKLINDIDAGKHNELLFELTNEDRMETLEALGSICNSIKVDRNNADVIPCKVSYADDSINLNVDESTIPSDPIVQSVDINKSTSYAWSAGGSEKGSTNAGLEAVLEGDPWLIRKSPIILKKWSMDTRLLKKELTRIPIWVKLHDVPIQVLTRKCDHVRFLVVKDTRSQDGKDDKDNDKGSKSRLQSMKNKEQRERPRPHELNDKKIDMAANGNGDDRPPPAGDGLPVLDLRMMEELYQPYLNGQGGPIAPIAIQATNFGLKNDMIQ